MGTGYTLKSRGLDRHTLPKIEESTMSTDNIIASAMALIARHEGYRRNPYKCTAGKLTVGYGRNLTDVGITRDEAGILMHNDVIRADQVLRIIFGDFDSFSASRQVALIDMYYNLGHKGFSGFKRMIRAIRQGDWRLAAQEAMQSKWAAQVGPRALRIESMLAEKEV